jgi:23S rRNA (uracil1939-C5)-methyltransferase/tRNA (uracil-5-)-methyltransferase
LEEGTAETDDVLPPVEAIGFQRSSVRQIIDVPYCPIATEPLNTKYQKIRQELLNQPYHEEFGATLLLRQANLGNDTIVTNPKEYMTTMVNGLSFKYMAGNFFQNNLHIIPKMVDVSMEQASPAVGDRKMTHFVDCYCGSGLFCLSAAQHFDTCAGIEINTKAIEEAEENANANALSHKCTFEAARAENIFDNPNVQAFPRDTTVVMLDPPRKGCDDTFLKQLENFRPQRIVYMSCNPATQARDAREMLSWGYKITFIQPFDLFPQTRHIECLTVLERIN